MLLRLFGSPALLAGASDDAALLLGPGKPLAVLVRLAVAGPAGTSREALVELLWSHADPERARASLRQALRQVRRALDAALIDGDADGTVRLASPLPDERSALLEAVERRDVDAVLALHRGPFMGDFRTTGAAGFERWIDGERQRLATAAAGVIEQAAREAMAAGRHRAARTLSGALFTVAPDPATAHLLALESAIAADDAIAARLAIEAHRRWLDDEGGAPSDALRPVLARAEALSRRRTVRPPTPVAGEPTTSDATPADDGESALAVLAIDTIGREAEFTALLAAWDRARHGLTTVRVEGEAGIGKTRLLRDLRGRWRTMGVPIVAVTALQGMRGTPLAFLADTVLALADAPGALGIAEESAATLVDFVPTLRGQYRGVPARDASASAVAQGDLAWRRAFALADLLLAVTDERPLVLLLDDLHWSESASLAVLDAAFDRARGARLLVVRATRPDPRSAAAPHRTAPRDRTLALAPLTADDTAALLSSLGDLPATDWAASLPSALHEATAGVPLAIFETLALLGDDAVLTLANGQWACSDPAGMAARLADRRGLDARLAALPSAERDIVQTLALAAVPLTTAMVVAVLDALAQARRLRPDVSGTDADPPAAERLESLLARGWIANDATMADPATAGATADTGRWRVRHDLIGDEALRVLGDGDPLERLLARILLEAGRSGTRRDAARYLHRAAALASRCDDTDLLDASFEAWLRSAGDSVAQLDHAARITLFAGDEETGIAAALRRRADEAAGRRRRRRQRLTAAIAALALTALWWTRAAAPTQVPNVPASLAFVTRPLLANASLPLQPIPVVEVRDAAGRRVDSASGPMTITLLGLPGGLTGVRRTTTQAGRASFIASIVTDSGETERGAVVRFTYPGLPPLDARVAERLANRRSTIRLLGFRPRAGAAAVGPSDTLTVPRGVVLQGEADFRISALWNSNAIVLLGVVPSWGPRETFHQSLGTVASPVVDTTVTYSVGSYGVQMPNEPGLYHIVFVMGAEETIGHMASGTNWTVGRHRWRDGNDIRDWAPWQLAAASRYGTTPTQTVRRYNFSRYDLSKRGPRDSVVVEPSMQAAAVLWVRVR